MIEACQNCHKVSMVHLLDRKFLCNDCYTEKQKPVHSINIKAVNEVCIENPNRAFSFKETPLIEQYVKALENLIDSKDEYLELIREELSDTSHIAANHHWKSDRIEEGKKLREKIEHRKNLVSTIKEQLKKDKT